jgi:hypothetical protein
MQTITAATTNLVEQLETLGFTSEADYAEHQAVIHKMHNLTAQQLRDSRKAQASQIVHLSETGVHAGRRLCLAPADQSSRSVHAAYAPLYREEFRALVCAVCLKVWADEAYEPGEEMPDYIAAARTDAQRPSVIPRPKVSEARGTP